MIKHINNRTLTIALEDSHWEMDKKSQLPVFRNFSMIESALRDTNGWVHHVRETFYAISRVNHVIHENNLLIEQFEVNIPFKKESIVRFALFELLNYYRPSTIKLHSVSPNDDVFFRRLKMQENNFNEFVGDSAWVSNFMKSMTNANQSDISEEIESIRNRLCDEANEAYSQKLRSPY